MALTIHRIATLAIFSVILASLLNFERYRPATTQIRTEDLKRKKHYVNDLNQLLSSILFDQSLPSRYSLRNFDLNQTIRDISGNWTIKHSTGSSFEYMRGMCLGNANSLQPTGSLDVKWVTFRDSDLPWLVSRCNRDTDPMQTGHGSGPVLSDAVPWSYALSYLSRMPLHLREHVRVVMVAPVSLSPLFKREHGTRRSYSSMSISESSKNSIEPHGLLSHDTAIFFGEPSFGTWIHEFSHAVDLHVGHFSSSRMWLEALEKDECIADEYASISPEEAFAQASILKLYTNMQWNTGNSIHDQQKTPIYYPKKPTDGPLTSGFITSYDPSQPADYDNGCMHHQLNVMECLDTFRAIYPIRQVIGSGDFMDSSLTTHCISLQPPQFTNYAIWWQLWLATVILGVVIVFSV
ncbi:hypothetical protein CPB86DRAFT_572642 [Serendipita vermifera]|nr:hypothetical protein CPB86DRAFT_572642 [Serendipita vermifera]